MFKKKSLAILAIAVLTLSLASSAVASGLQPNFNIGLDPFTGAPFFNFGLSVNPGFNDPFLFPEDDFAFFPEEEPFLF